MTNWDRALIALTFLAAFAGFYMLPRAVAGSPGSFVVTVGGRRWRQFESGRPRDVLIGGVGGWCRMRIGSGKAAVIASDCPNHLCVSQGKIEGPGETIVCLPHRIVVSFESVDSASGDRVDAVIK